VNDIVERGAVRHLTVADLKRNSAMIQAAIKEEFLDGVHYGTIPGTDKPTLYKAGAEKICAMFLLGVDPEVNDLSTPDLECRFRVRVRLFHTVTDTTVGYGVGEASTLEEKYRWRAAVCDEEFEQTDPGDKRIAYKKKKGGGHYTVRQVRTNPADLANTVLKMAKKRAQIDAVLTCTAASDAFGQDAEDLTEELRDEIYGEGYVPKANRGRPQRRSGPSTGAPPPRPPAEGPASSPPPDAPQGAGGELLATQGQQRMIFARLKAAGIEEGVIEAKFGCAIAALRLDQVNEVLKYIEEQAQ
jgi:hypothetical protein